MALSRNCDVIDLAIVYMTWYTASMQTYQIAPAGAGWFQVIVTMPNGGTWVKSDFVSEAAAKKWIMKCIKRVGGSV